MVCRSLAAQILLLVFSSHSGFLVVAASERIREENKSQMFGRTVPFLFPSLFQGVRLAVRYAVIRVVVQFVLRVAFDAVARGAVIHMAVRVLIRA